MHKSTIKFIIGHENFNKKCIKGIDTIFLPISDRRETKNGESIFYKFAIGIFMGIE